MPAEERGNLFLQIALAAVLGVSTVWLATLATVHSLGISGQEGASIPIPETPKGLLTAAKIRFAQDQSAQDQNAPANDRQTLQKLAIAAPLAHEPFAYLGHAAQQAGDIAQAEKLLIEARDRRPRSRITRLSLLAIYGKRADLPAMAGELIPLMRLEPEMVTPMAKALLKTIRKPSEVAQLAEIFSPYPQLYDQLAEQAAQANLPPQMLTAFVTNDPLAKDRGTAPFGEQILASLVRQGHYTQARNVWAAMSGSGKLAYTDAGSDAVTNNNAVPANLTTNAVFSGDFSNQSAPAPFNWELFQTRNGVAERQAQGGLFVDYFGRGTEIFARQLLNLAPGRYRLAVVQNLDSPAGSSGLAWTIRCIDRERPLANRNIQETSQDKMPFTADFTVPAHCTTQWLALGGQGELRSNDGQRATIRNVAITRLDAATGALR